MPDIVRFAAAMGQGRRGHARACVTALLTALDDRGVARVDLFATTDGDALYRDLGFRDAPYAALRRP